MANLRGARIPESLSAYVSGISGFSEEAIDQACMAIEREPVSEKETRWPELGKMISFCRRNSMTEKRREARYCDECREFSGFLYFDAPRNGNRLHGVDVVKALSRYALPCPTCRPAKVTE